MHEISTLLSADTDEQELLIAADGLLTAMLHLNVKAHRHPLGFVHFAFRNEDRQLRIHIWPSQRELQNRDFVIHDHIFSFHSRLLLGSFQNIDYEVIENSDGIDEIYLVTYDAHRSLLASSGRRVQVVMRTRSQLSQFDRYAISSRHFHESVPEPGQLICTLVEPTAHVDGQARVVGPNGRGALEFERSELSSTDAHSLLTMVLYELRRGQHA